MSLAREYSFSSSSSSSTVALGVCTSWVLLTRWALLPNGTYRTHATYVFVAWVLLVP